MRFELGSRTKSVMSRRNSRIDNEIGDADKASTLSARVRGWIVSIAILGIALGLIFVLSSNWTTWVSGGEEQKTDDAYLRADLTPLSTKAAGLVASVEVSDYQRVKAGQLLARLRDEDYRAQVIQAAKPALANARSGVTATEADVQRTSLERKRQESLVASESATRQKLEQAVADQERFRAQLSSREAEISANGTVGEPRGGSETRQSKARK